jgi:hypothetical protein
MERVVPEVGVRTRMRAGSSVRSPQPELAREDVGYGGRKTSGVARKMGHVLCKHMNYHGLAASFFIPFLL